MKSMKIEPCLKFLGQLCDFFYEFLNFEFHDVTNFFFFETSVFEFSGARITIMKVKNQYL
jgi:hypothetical protein